MKFNERINQILNEKNKDDVETWEKFVTSAKGDVAKDLDEIAQYFGSSDKSALLGRDVRGFLSLVDKHKASAAVTTLSGKIIVAYKKAIK